MSGPLLKGTQVPLGEIRVGQEIGAGGFGVVHEAELSGVKFPFAIKFLHPSAFATDAAKARDRFFREAETLLRLRHPHIIPIYGIGEHEGRPYILMERFGGKPLQKAREVGQPKAENVLRFVDFVAGALGHAHARNVVHRDVKPSNLMTTAGDARVLDFGIAAALDPDGRRLTRTGGTQVGDAYSAPELLENPRLVDPRCDVYSLGACWFWTLTGKVPTGLDWHAALKEVPDVSADYQRVLLRTLAKPDARYATMEELGADVRSLRVGARPVLRPDDVRDEDALALALVGAACHFAADAVSVAQINDGLTRSSNGPLAIGVVHRKLLRLALVETFLDHDWRSRSEERMLRLTDAGVAWLEANESRAAALLRDLPPRPVPPDPDDIPF